MWRLRVQQQVARTKISRRNPSTWLESSAAPTTKRGGARTLHKKGCGLCFHNNSSIQVGLKFAFVPILQRKGASNDLDNSHDVCEIVVSAQAFDSCKNLLSLHLIKCTGLNFKESRVVTTVS